MQCFSLSSPLLPTLVTHRACREKRRRERKALDRWTRKGVSKIPPNAFMQRREKRRRERKPLHRWTRKGVSTIPPNACRTLANHTFFFVQYTANNGNLFVTLLKLFIRDTALSRHEYCRDFFRHTNQTTKNNGKSEKSRCGGGRRVKHVQTP